MHYSAGSNESFSYLAREFRMSALPEARDQQALSIALPNVDFRTHPDRYLHWKLSVDGAVATLKMDVAEDGGLRPGYKLKLNSYDLGVDIELHDALQRIRFEHPNVRTVVLTSGKDRIFCSGANIFMLGLSSHAWKVNFCKFTNETRNGMEDSSRHSGIKFLAAVNGACAGGGYELALACDEILLVDDRSSAVSLPEVPLLGVLPGTGGLTRVTDKRKVRRDLADIFCTTAEGVRGQRAKDWKLVDDIAKPANFADKVRERVTSLAAQSSRPSDAQGVNLLPLERTITDTTVRYKFVQADIDRKRRVLHLTISAPQEPQPDTIEAIERAGCTWWPLQMSRELDDAILHLRTNETEIGTWLLHARGDSRAVLGADATLAKHAEHWFVRETMGMMRRTFARLDVSSRSLFALVDPNSCFAGSLLEIALAADRTYMLSTVEGSKATPYLHLSQQNFGPLPMVNGLTRLEQRFYRDAPSIQRCAEAKSKSLSAIDADKLGLVTSIPDEIDWDDEVRLAVEERASLSPDALTGMEANLRFGVYENLETRVFGRLSAWQNWIFIRPNAVGEHGALKVYGKGDTAAFEWQRI
jgi:benzoyl-CoA-dihydrodiol lyase